MSQEAENFAWMARRVSRLDALIAAGMEDAWKTPGVAIDDHAAAVADLEHVKHGKDCHYDSPSIGLLYAAVYHGKRFHQAVSALYKPLVQAVSEGRPIDIMDVGAGTGATAWAVALILLTLDARDTRSPEPARIVECDASPFMLRQAELLWQRLCQAFARIPQLVDRLPPVHESWDRVEMPNPRAPWIVASHLLHATDAATQATQEADSVIASTLDRIAKRHDASRIIAWQSTQVKQVAMDGALNELRKHGWCDTRDAPTGTALTAESARMETVRTFMTRHVPASARLHVGHWLSEYPPKVLSVRRGAPPGQLFDYKPLPRFVFDDQQEAVFSGKPKHALIQGAAGSGKTLLLAARLLQCVASAAQGRSRDVLVTAFNKNVIADIRRYVEAGVADLAPLITSDEHGGWAHEAQWAHVRARVFDNLPWGFGPASGRVQHVRGVPEGAFDAVARDLSRAWGCEVSPSFVEDEFELIVYGRCELCPASDAHGVARRGRGHVRALTDQHWCDLTSSLARVLGPPVYTAACPPTFCHARRRFLDALRAPSHRFATRFTHMFVDEAQDFTRTDWRILEAMATEDAAWTICWDRTQAVRTGRTFDSPTAVVPKLRSVDRTLLQRGYRVPRTVARLANLLTEQISGDQRDLDASERVLRVEPQLHAVPGARPLVVFGKDTAALSTAVAEAVTTIAHVCPDIRLAECMLAECTRAAGCDQVAAIRAAVERAGLTNVRATTILRDKGPEYDPVIWLADLPMPSVERWGESLFAILTRTRGFLLIAHTAAIDSRAREFLRSVWQSNQTLVRWSMPAKAYWQKA